MKNKNLYYALAGIAVLGGIYFITKKKKEEVVVNLNPPMEVDETTQPSTSTPPIVPKTSGAVDILDKLKELIQEVKKKSTVTPPTTIP